MVNDIIDTIAEMVNYPIKPSDYISVQMIPPVVLILQLIEMTAGSSQNILSVFTNLQLPVDPLGFLKEYVPFLNWDKFEKTSAKYANEKTVENEYRVKNEAKLQGQAAAIQQQSAGGNSY